MANKRASGLHISMLVWNSFQNDARVLKEAQTLVRSGHTVTVFALLQSDDMKAAETLEPGLSVIRIQKSLLTRLFRVLRRAPDRATNVVRGSGAVFVDAPLKKTRLAQIGQIVSRTFVHCRFVIAMLRNNPDVVHAHDVNTLPTGWIVARLRGAKLVYDAHEISTDREGYRLFRGPIAAIERRLFPRVDAAITTTEMRAKFFARAYGIKRPLVLQNRPRFSSVPKNNRVREELGLNDTLPIILYQGGLQPGRGLEDLVHAMPHLPPCYLVFIGGGRLLIPLQKRVTELGLAGSVHFIPTVDLDDLPFYTAGADIGVQPLRNTCLNHLTTDSNKLFEYMMAGIPVVASDFPEIRKIVSTHQSGLLFDPEKKGDLAIALGQLVSDVDQRAKYANNALHAAKHLTWEAQEETLRKLYADFV